jgi:hypothetical protein
LPAIALDVCAAVVAAGSFLAGAVAVVREVPFVLKNAPRQVLPHELRENVARINELSSPDAPVFYVMRERETWVSRLWKRALYPRPVFYVDDETQVNNALYRRLRAKHRIRYAVSVGSPPLDPGFDWYAELRSFPRGAQVWFGRLR